MAPRHLEVNAVEPSEGGLSRGLMEDVERGFCIVLADVRGQSIETAALLPYSLSRGEEHGDAKKLWRVARQFDRTSFHQEKIEGGLVDKYIMVCTNAMDIRRRRNVMKDRLVFDF